jgi:hypothetical protein
MAVGKRDKIVPLQEVEDTLAQEVHDYADVASVIEAFSEMNASVPVDGIVGLQCCQHAEFYSASVTILLHRTDDFDGNVMTASLAIFGLDYFAKGALSEQLQNPVCWESSASVDG